MQIEGKTYISNKNFDIFLSALNGRKEYISQLIFKTQPLQQAPVASFNIPAVYIYQPLFSPNIPGSPFFSSSNISDFLET